MRVEELYSQPHERGGEPIDTTMEYVQQSAIPTCVGMNRTDALSDTGELTQTPRAWG